MACDLADARACITCGAVVFFDSVGMQWADGGDTTRCRTCGSDDISLPGFATIDALCSLYAKTHKIEHLIIVLYETLRSYPCSKDLGRQLARIFKRPASELPAALRRHVQDSSFAQAACLVAPFLAPEASQHDQTYASSFMTFLLTTPGLDAVGVHICRLAVNTHRSTLALDILDHQYADVVGWKEASSRIRHDL